MGGLGILAKGGSRYRKSESGREQIYVKCRGGTKSIPGELEFVRIAVDRDSPDGFRNDPNSRRFLDWLEAKIRGMEWLTGFTGIANGVRASARDEADWN